MVKLNAYKDGVGNIIITEDSFDYLLNSLDNQKYIHEFSLLKILYEKRIKKLLMTLIHNVGKYNMLKLKLFLLKIIGG